MYRHLGNTDILMYDVFGYAGVLLMLLFNFYQFKKNNLLPGKTFSKLIPSIKKSKAAHNTAFLAELLILTVFQHILPLSYSFHFGDLFNTGGNYFSLLTLAPIFVSVICFFTGNDVFKTFDLMTLAYPIALFFAKIGCFCSGCCQGVECSFGLYNHKTETIQFPSQLVEAGLAFIIFVFLLFYRKKAKEGTMFPVYLIAYSSTRFFSEFTRIEENVLWIFKTYHFLCIAGIVIGIAELFIVKKYKEKIRYAFDIGYDSLYNCAKSMILKSGLMTEKNIVHHKKKKKNKKIHNKK